MVIPVIYWNLLEAVSNNDTIVAENLLKQGADANAKHVLWTAVKNDNINMVRLLLMNGAKVGTNHLERAVMNDNLPMATTPRRIWCIYRFFHITR